MASGVVRGAISTVIEDDKLPPSPRTTAMRQFGTQLLREICKSEREVELFDEFSERLVSAIKDMFSSLPHSIKCASTKRHNLWMSFHQHRLSVFPDLWTNFLTHLPSLNTEPESEHVILTQSVNQEVFQQLISSFFATECLASVSCQQDSVQLPPDELNAMQYAFGYVPHKLLKKYEKLTDPKALCYVECLRSMAVVEADSDFLSYTKKWMETVNRGGLFPLNDETFHLFIEIEKIVRTLLPKHMVQVSASSTSTGPESVIESVLQNDDVQFKWSLLAYNFDADDEAQELLREIIKLWITIRGFSTAAMWMETYKQAKQSTTQKSTGLRKKLS